METYHNHCVKKSLNKICWPSARGAQSYPLKRKANAENSQHELHKQHAENES